MVHVSGALAQSTSPLAVCMIRRTTKDALNEPEASVGAKPVWLMSQSSAVPKLLLFLHSAQPTDELDVNPVPATVTDCRLRRSVDGVTVTAGDTCTTGASDEGAGSVDVVGAGSVMVVG